MPQEFFCIHALLSSSSLCVGARHMQSLEAAEEQLLPLRQALHRRLGLPQDRPLLRCANALTFAEGGQQPEDGGAGRVKGRCGTIRLTYTRPNGLAILIFVSCMAWRVAFPSLIAPACPACRLRDVHVGLPASGVPGGRQHLVQGSYEYYHYMQVAHASSQCSA